jgi:preprotein translocase subunit SecG
MLTVLLVIHLMIAVALVGTVLLQRSEGGALGIGGGGGGGFMTGRGTANALTRLTALLGLGFFLSSIALTVLARLDHSNRISIDSIGKAAATAPVVPGTGAAPGVPVTPAANPAATPANTPATPVVPGTNPAKTP